MELFEKLLKKKIIWKEKKVGGVEFFAIVEGENYELKMNDFPDEPLYTLKYRGMKSNFDDVPENWVIPEFKD